MSGPGDEKLMPYADGVLVGAELAELEADLAARPDLRQRLAPFTATRPDVIGRVFDPIAAAPVPEHLIALVMGAGASSAAKPAEAPRKSAEVLQFRRPEQKRASGAAKLTAWGPAAVAAAMIAAVAIGSWQLQSISGPSAKRTSQVASVIPGLDIGQLASELDKLPSRKSAAIAGWTVMPINTFASNDKRWCRELVAEKSGGQTYAGVACRSNAGQWSVVAAAERSPAHFELRDKVVPLSERPPAPVEDAIRDLGNGPLLDSAQEARLIAGGWGPARDK